MITQEEAVVPEPEGVDEFHKRWLTVADVAQELEINVQTARRMMRRGDIPAFKIGGEYRVKIEEYADWLEAQRVRPESGA